MSALLSVSQAVYRQSEDRVTGYPGPILRERLSLARLHNIGGWKNHNRKLFFFHLPPPSSAVSAAFFHF